MNKILLILSLLYLATPAAFAQQAFVKACKAPRAQHRTVQNDIKWFKFLYKTNDCNKIGIELSKVTSLSDIVQPHYEYRPEMINSWAHSFKSIYGDLSLRDAFDQWHFTNDIRHYIFKKIEPYADLPNVTSFTYSRATLPYPAHLCDAVKLYPKLKTVSMELEFLDDEADKCLSERGIRVILIGQTTSLGNNTFQSEIVGIENYLGDLNELLQINNLQYLGISDNYNQDASAAPVALSILGGLPNLTHLSLTSANIARIQDLKYSFNLTWLSIACTASEYNLDQSPCAINAPYLKNLDFMSKLTYLEHLDLSYNMLQAIPDFHNLTHLKKLVLRGNLIQDLPWTTGQTSLDYLDLSGNKISSIDNIANLTNLTFLNVSGNKISDFSALDNLRKMKFLNISNNIFQKDLSTINPGPQLKVLSLNGGCIQSEFPDLFPTEHLIENNHPEASKYKEAIHGDYLIQNTEELSPEDEANMTYTDIKYWDSAKKISCKNKEMIAANTDFSKFKNLEALSLRYNNFTKVPNLLNLPRLKALNLEGNQITDVPHALLPPGLKAINISFNKVSNLPDLRAYPSLLKIDLSGNYIKTLKDLKIINKNMSLNLSGNQITNILIFDQARFRETAPTLYGNPVDGTVCPVHSKNADLAFFCRGYRNGWSSAELDSLGN